MWAGLPDARTLGEMISYHTYISDPEWSNSFFGKFIWLFRSSGNIEIGNNEIVISSGSLNLTIQRDSIRSIITQAHSPWSKPIPMNYIDISYKSKGQIKNVYLTPKVNGKSGWFTSVWTINKAVSNRVYELDQWYRNY